MTSRDLGKSKATPPALSTLKSRGLMETATAPPWPKMVGKEVTCGKGERIAEVA